MNELQNAKCNKGPRSFKNLIRLDCKIDSLKRFFLKEGKKKFYLNGFYPKSQLNIVIRKNRLK